MNPLGLIMIQAMYYFFTVVLTIGFGFAFMRGFLWTYFKVRTSFGKYVMIKVRSPLRDYFMVGWVDDGFLVFNFKVDKGAFKPHQEIRLALDNTKKVFYRCMNVMWIDIDEETGNICATDYKAVSGFDKVKFSDLLKRAIMRPEIMDAQRNLLIFLIIICILLGGVNIYLGYTNSQHITTLIQNIPAWIADAINSAKGVVVGSISNI